MVVVLALATMGVASGKPHYCGFDDIAPPVPLLGANARKLGAKLRQVHVIFRYERVVCAFSHTDK